MDALKTFEVPIAIVTTNHIPVITFGILASNVSLFELHFIKPGLKIITNEHLDIIPQLYLLSRMEQQMWAWQCGVYNRILHYGMSQKQ